MISIAGLGIAGSYLLRRMSLDGMEVSGFDPRVQGFYLPCGYATNRHRLGIFLEKADLDPEKYIKYVAEDVIMASETGMKLHFRSNGFSTIDKNLLESDLVEGLKTIRKRAQPPSGNGSILIDATGVSRYYLGQAKNDFLMYAREYLTNRAVHEDFYFRYFARGRGYYWEFPLGDQYHVGAGADSREQLDLALKEIRDPVRVMSRKIRLAPLFDQMFRNNIIGVGEAIGTVSPITGEGILPSMESAEILFQQLKKYEDIESVKENYSRRIRSAFSRYDRLFQLLLDTRNGDLKKIRNLSAISAAREDFENFGIELKVSSVLKQLAFR